VSLLLTLGSLPLSSAFAETDLMGPAKMRALPMSLTLSYERAQLPAGERMGLVGGSLLFEATEGWWFGPSVYGAITGERAGLFVGGVEGQRRWRLGSGWQAVGGLYVGGGGGAAAQVGDGLMLRPSLSLLKDFAGWQAGLSLSDTRFPDGNIRRSPWGLVVAWNGTYRYTPAEAIGQPLNDMRATGLGFDQVQGLASVYPLKDGSGRRVGLPGARLLKRSGPWGFSVESSAAARGGAAGYMEILGGLSVHQPLASGVEVGARASLGLGGGGAVASGGGGLTKLSAFVAWEPQPGWQLGLEAGPVRGAGGAPKASAVQAWLGMDLQPHTGKSAGDVSGRVAGYEWTMGLQQIRRAQRQEGPSASIDLIMGKLERHLDNGLYLSAEASSAFGGGAGAFSVGLLGVGAATSLEGHSWRFGAELLAGAAGGGGVKTGGGGLITTRAWAGYSVSPASQLRVGLGGLRAMTGSALSSPVVELSFSHRFGLGSR
jgi:hypothetical protein